MRVLVVDDDPHIRRGLEAQIQLDRFDVVSCADGESALAALTAENPPSIAVVDWSLPDRSGVDVCRTLRESGHLSSPYIIMLTVKKEARDVAVALDAGANDYVTKPFSPRELLERVKAILRRARPVQSSKVELLSMGGLVLDPEKLKVTLHGKTISLTSHEYKLLYALMRSPGRVFQSDEIRRP